MKLVFCIFLTYSIFLLATPLKIVTPIAPNYDLIKPVLGDMGTIQIIIPANVEVHNFEPTPRDILAINKADILFYTADKLEPWIAKFKSEFIKTLTIKELTSFIKNYNGNPHIWLDPIYAKEVVIGITNTLIEINPQNKEVYSKNSEIFQKKLQNLHEAYRTTLKKYKNRKIIFIGHNAFSFLENRYGLDIVSPFSNSSENSEPTPKAIKSIIDFGKKNNIKYIFYEKNQNSKFADVIAKELDAKLIPLDTLETARGDYIDLMNENLKNLEQGLKNE